MVEMSIAGVTIDANKHPVVVLRADSRILPIWIGQPEALSISQALENITLKRPLTHDLIVYILKGFRSTLKYVHVYKLENQTYYAHLVLVQKDDAGNETEIIKVDCRPSDGIALAARVACPVYVAESVLAEGGQDASTIFGTEDDEPDIDEKE